MADDHHDEGGISRRHALECMLWAGTGVLWAVTGGVPRSIGLLDSAAAATATGLTFLQISDSHVGFDKPANPHAIDTLKEAIDRIKAMPQKPSFMLHTGDITHLSKPEEFDSASQLLSALKVSELHTTPGEHDVTDTGAAYFERFGKASNNKGYYSFDHQGVHFIALVNVMNFKPNGLGALGDDQLAWLEQDLKGRSASMPIVVFAHMPMWTIYQPWGWGTGDSDQAMSYLRRFGSVTVLNGHIHQIVQKVEGNITFHTARSTAYPQPTAGNGPGPGPLKVPGDQLTKMLGVTSIRILNHPLSAVLTDTTLG